MALEMTICCCGASKWTRVIAWIQIVANTLYLIASVVSLVALIAFMSELKDEDIVSDEGLVWAALAIAIVFAFLGIVMGIILLKGTNQKRVGYLRSWLIYGGAALVVSIVSIVLNSINSTADTLTSTVASGVVGIALNLFTFVVVFIHMKEINEGVFDVQPTTSQPVYM